MPKKTKNLITPAIFFLFSFLILFSFFTNNNPTNLETKEVLAAGEGWYNSSWNYRRQIIIDHTKVTDVADPSTTYANFPVYINATGLSNINANGTDIRFDRHVDYRSPTKEVWSMCCYNCGATFPNRFKKELLLTAWNTRHVKLER